MWQNLDYNSLSNPLFILFINRLLFFLTFNHIAFLSLFFLKIFEEFFNILHFFRGIVQIFFKLFLNFLFIKCFVSLEGGFVDIELQLEAISFDLFMFILFSQQFASHYFKHFLFNLFALLHFFLKSVFCDLFLLLSLLEELLFSLFYDEITAFVDQVCDCTMGQLPLNLQVPSSFPQMLHKLFKISPFSHIELYVLIVCFVLFE